MNSEQIAEYFDGLVPDFSNVPSQRLDGFYREDLFLPDAMHSPELNMSSSPMAIPLHSPTVSLISPVPSLSCSGSSASPEPSPDNLTLTSPWLHPASAHAEPTEHASSLFAAAQNSYLDQLDQGTSPPPFQGPSAYQPSTYQTLLPVSPRPTSLAAKRNIQMPLRLDVPSANPFAQSQSQFQSQDTYAFSVPRSVSTPDNLFGQYGSSHAHMYTQQQQQYGYYHHQFNPRPPSLFDRTSFGPLSAPIVPSSDSYFTVSGVNISYEDLGLFANPNRDADQTLPTEPRHEPVPTTYAHSQSHSWHPSHVPRRPHSALGIHQRQKERPIKPSPRPRLKRQSPSPPPRKVHPQKQQVAQFVNFTPADASELLSGVEPSGASSKWKREEARLAKRR